jgi:hypothetical protein
MKSACKKIAFVTIKISFPASADNGPHLVMWLISLFQAYV